MRQQATAQTEFETSQVIDVRGSTCIGTHTITSLTAGPSNARAGKGIPLDSGAHSVGNVGIPIIEQRARAAGTGINGGDMLKAIHPGVVFCLLGANDSIDPPDSQLPRW